MLKKDVVTDRRTDGQTDGRTDIRTYIAAFAAGKIYTNWNHTESLNLK